MKTGLSIGMILFDNFTALDFFAPHEVFSWLPSTTVSVVGPTLSAVTSETNVRVLPDIAYDDALPFDILFIPGGSGINQFITNTRAMAFVERQGARARYVASVCTGSLALGAAGLLDGYRAATHWASMPFLSRFGAIPTDERFVIDRNRFTSGGVTAGLDFALKIATEFFGPEKAQAIQLMLEYRPTPEFPNAGSPATSDPAVLASVNAELAILLEARHRAVETAANALAARRAKT